TSPRATPSSPVASLLIPAARPQPSARRQRPRLRSCSVLARLAHQRRCDRRERDGPSHDRRRHRNIPLRLYLTGNNASPCPSATPGPLPAAAPVRRAAPTDRTSAEPASTTVTTGNPATSSTSQDCPPEDGGGLFNGAPAVDLNPLTTGA